MMKKLLLTLFVFTALVQSTLAATFTAGTDYTVVNATRLAQQQVHVVEFFNYGCPWCARLEPHVEAWLKSKPKYVNFERMPVSFEQGWDTYAKAYYIAQALGIEAKITPALFHAIHGSDNTQANDLSSQAAIINFFVEQGVDRNTVTNAFSGGAASLDLKIQQNLKTMQGYQVWGIPTFVIGDKYVVSLQQAKDPQRFIATVNYLINLAHK